MLTRNEIRKISQVFTSLRAMVIGDVMIDSYIWGRVDRISPEAPVPVVSVTRRENRLGGAANVALNLQALGARPILCTVCGNDEKAGMFTALMKKHRLMTSGIMTSDKRITTTKFRIIGNNYQMLRVDEEISDPLNPADEENCIRMIVQQIRSSRPDVIIFEDYDKGAITPLLISSVMDEALKKGIPVAVDPKKRNFHEYRGVSLFKPNLKELAEGLGMGSNVADQSKLISAAGAFRKKQGIHTLLLTLSEAGVYVLGGGKKSDAVRIPAEVRNVADVSGAGDTVIATASLAIASGLSAVKSAWIANIAGGLVCEEVGVVPVNRAKLFYELSEIADRSR